MQPEIDERKGPWNDNTDNMIQQQQTPGCQMITSGFNKSYKMITSDWNKSCQMISFVFKQKLPLITLSFLNESWIFTEY